MRVIASTVVRESRVGTQLTGSLYEVDWERREVLASLPIPDPRNPASDDNPRGGIRGGRGIAATPEGIVVANYDTLYVYDRDWSLLRTIEHPLFLGLHEICFDGTWIYLSSTAIDAVVRVGPDDAVEVVWDPHEDAEWRQALRIPPRAAPLDPASEQPVAPIDECHINGVALGDEGVVVNLGKVLPELSRARRAGVTGEKVLARAGLRSREKVNPSRCLIVSVDPSGRAELLRELTTLRGLPLHNGQALADGRTVVNDSNEDEVRAFSAAGEELAAIEIPGIWLRGLFPLGGDRILVGSAPASVSQVDLQRGEIVDSMQISENPNEAIHGLIALDFE